MRRIAALSIAIMALAPAALADLNSHDRKFIREAAMAGVFEVQANSLGRQKARNPEVKQHSMHMVTDHTQANRELTALARQEGIRPPTIMSPKQRSIMTKLRRLRGAAFDREHAKTQLKAHEEAVALFSKQIAKGKDRQLVTWAKRTLPKLEEHLHMWQRANSEVMNRP